MDENIKQRLVGAAVLVALAVIFLPALFDKDERVAIDTTSQIPPAPTIETVDIPRPTKPEGINVPPAGTLFQPELVEDEEDKEKPETIKTKTEEESKPTANDSKQVASAVEADKTDSTQTTDTKLASTAKPEPQTKVVTKPVSTPLPTPVTVKPVPTKPKTPAKPRLSESGVPIGWVIQAASFKSAKAAQGFTDKLLKAKYEAYFKSVETSKGEYFRVFVGPYVDEQQAIDVKRVIDKAYKVRSQVLRFNPISGN